ncbi:extracellular solute-binding protein [Goodfellowiella coeruleoviolacea]|uniref:Carbohydrate ABC transporter substrate-binding protein, CUT1 family n=1 Tax=Goodfellowiella coeruleoviolacea TaxID=334858 RepID=A0AAE3GGD9_9PSEU|nr:extracellular solute-binding protein [Goodfellowiella coeruleoviolacea]MCP2166869.1 carbohydrate ABC transporter substrate-binding protein, CUT1 family [Goodfellowiella coeruleoviolacea]
MGIQKYENDPYKGKLSEALLQDRLDPGVQPPDIFFNWGGGSLKSFVDAGEVRDLSGLLTEHPEVRQRFFPNALESASYGDKVYGLPMNGVQPVVFFYHKELFARAGAEVPTTFDELLTAVGKLRAAGITPITLGGASKWTDLMYIEYLLDRIAGPELFVSIQNGDRAAWNSPEMLRAATMVRQLVDAGAFQQGFETMSYDDGSTSKQLAEGQAAMELMITVQYPNLIDRAPELIEKDQLGWFPFPTVSGGKGDPRNVVGSPTNYYSVRADSPAADGADDYLTDVLMSDEYVNWLIDKGEVPPVNGIEPKLSASPHADWLGYVYSITRDAPHFQLSWDQALSPEDAEVLLTELDLLFRKQITPEQFCADMQSKTSAAR